MHLNAFYDLTTHTYTDALIQPVHCKMNSALSAAWLTAMKSSKEEKHLYW